MLLHDGTNYNGFQRQAKGIPTVQGTVEDAVAAVTGQTVTVIGAGRTDTGVHANGQVIAFDVGWKHSADTLLSAINAVLPDDIALQNLAMLGEVVPGQRGFHPRFDAVARLYKYTVYAAPQRDPLLRRCAWHISAAIDVDALQAAADLLIGEHDFAAFGKPPKGDSPRGDNTVRVVMRSAWTSDGALLIYGIQANAFLQHMVRRIVGLLVAVGRGNKSVVDFEATFRRGKLAAGTPLAPAHGLVLEHVEYPGETLVVST
ncbi:MAG: tRNA pseudouridine(38-40) synthase TruA [Chloroflexota bacterium]